MSREEHRRQNGFTGEFQHNSIYMEYESMRGDGIATLPASEE